MPASTENLRLVAYLRDSGGTDQDLSLAQQEDAIRAWCQEHGHRLTSVYKDEATSGKSTVGRAGFHALMKHFSSQECRDHGVILWKYNRFARDFDDAQFYKADLRRRGYLVKSMNDHVPDGPDGRMFEAAIDWMNQRFREDMVKDVQRGLRHMVQANGGVTISNIPPGFRVVEETIGTRRNGKPHNVRRLIPDQDQLEVVRYAWKLRASGTSLRAIHAALRDRFGKPFYSHQSSYRHMFKNSLYIGELRYFKHTSNVVVIPDYCEPIIDGLTWAAVQELNKRNSRMHRFIHMSHTDEDPNPNHPRRTGSRFLLSGLLVCSKCGAMMHGKLIKGSQKKGYRYYVCDGKKHIERPCDSGFVPQAPLEQNISELLLQYSASDQLRNALLDAAVQRKLERETTQTQIAALEEENLASLKRMEHIIRAIEEAGHNETLLSRLRSLEAAVQDRELQISALRMVRPSAPYSKAEIDAGLRQLKASLQHEPVPRSNLQSLVKSIQIERKGKEVSGVVSFFIPDFFMPMLSSEL
ncbi:MAG: recombinase family protein [Anaerolineales bacterium]|nr:recombinase family protein [Anaerolineales bacterium]